MNALQVALKKQESDLNRYELAFCQQENCKSKQDLLKHKINDSLICLDCLNKQLKDLEAEKEAEFILEEP